MNINTPLVSQIPSLRKLWQEAFGDTDEFLNHFFKTAFHPNRCRCIADGEHITAALYWFDCAYEGKTIAYIYAVATAHTHRGQGLCRKLMDDTHKHLASLGYEGALLVPGSKTLFDMYEKMGYKTCSNISQFQCNCIQEELQICEISPLEYARLRKLLLPKRSVIQEQENLDFLKTQVHFYMGLGFLLAAYGQKDTLYGVELLGDVTAASAITHTLGFAKGSFRVPGNGRPFAMYYPLTSSALLPPNYFGFAFD